MNNTLFTIGHSTRSIDEFLHILMTFKISLVVDVRHYPGSRYCPQFGKERLAHSLKEVGIEYVSLVGLGGRRKVDEDSALNAGWRSGQFRGYADYMQTENFKKYLNELIELSDKNQTAIMCSEAVPWRCHRSMISDALLMYDFIVWDIITENNVKPHILTEFAKVNHNRITYPKPLSKSLDLTMN